MTVLHHPRRRRLRGGSPRRIAPALAAAAAIGLAATVSFTAAAGIAVVVSIGAAVTVQPSVVTMVLVASIYLEAIALGGVTISRLIAPAALYFIVVQWLRRRASLRFAAPLALVIAYSLWALTSLVWTVDTGLTAALLASLVIALVYMFAIAMLVDSEARLRTVLLALAVAASLVGAMSLLSFAGLGGTEDSLQGGRAQGAVGDPNFFANIELVAFPLMLALASDVPRPWMRYGLYGATLVTLASILSTLSRGGMIALVLVLLAMCVMPARAILGSRQQKRRALLVLAAGILVLSSRPGFRTEVIARAETIFGGGEKTAASSGSGRTEIWKGARHVIEDRPVVGVGYGGFPAVSRSYLLHTPGVDVERFQPRAIQVHSAYLGTAAELGLVGLALFLGLLLATALSLRRTAARAFRAGVPFVGRVANACVLSLVAWTVSSMFIQTETARALWILIGLSLALPRMIPRPPTRPPTWVSARMRRDPAAAPAGGALRGP